MSTVSNISNRTFTGPTTLLKVWRIIFQ